MPILRNPFARRPGLALTTDENARPGSSSSSSAAETSDAKKAPGFERGDTVGSKASSSVLSLRSGRSQDNGEYKLSVVNDSGVYLPPSPTEEKEPAWPKRYLSRNSSDNRSELGEIEHFSISRESFDSYRRSFDVSARTPVIPADAATLHPQRQSLDSSSMRLSPGRFPRSSLGGSLRQQRHSTYGQREPPTPEESFEDVGLNDDGRPNLQQQQQPPSRKRGFFSKFGTAPETTSGQETPISPTSSTTNMQAVSRFLGGGRRRGHSGQGAELGAMPSRGSGSSTPGPILERPRTGNSVSTEVLTSTREEIAA